MQYANALWQCCSNSKFFEGDHGFRCHLDEWANAKKLQCSYENLMSNNFRITDIPKKKNELQTKASLQRILLKKVRALHGLACARRPRTLSIHLAVRNAREKLQKNIYGKSKTSLWRNLSTGTPPKMFKYNPLLCSFCLQLIFFSEKPFYGNYSTLDSHTNTVISLTFAHSFRWRRKLWQGLLSRWL